jgi:para-nitrobenzyl esterase
MHFPKTDPAVVAGKQTALVNTCYGTVRGYIHDGIFTFKGIPYGKAERFMPAEAPEVWSDIRSCLTYGAVCPPSAYPDFNDEFAFAFQVNRGVSSEDCLNLNIWTKEIHAARKRPVMVWLHGGGFSSGSSLEFPSLDGENLSRTGDVVVVSIHHRLHVLGFLDLSAYGDQYKYSANAGAMDMVEALKWVQVNIAAFGGDPGNVTIFGQSGGGTKVMCLMNAPSAKGLFHKVIVQSGSSLTRIMEAGVARQISAALLKELKISPAQVGSLQTIALKRLEAAGAKALMKVKKQLKPEEYSVFGLEWEPVRDGHFLPCQPDEIVARALSKDVPLLVGSCKNEFTPFMPGTRDISLEDARHRLYEIYGDKTEDFIEAVHRAYPETNKPSDYLDIDFLFRDLVLAHADQKLSLGTAPVYMYLFTWQSPVLEGIFKTCHCMDLPFVFNNIHRCEEMTGGGNEAYRLAAKISQAWVRFAETGNPNHDDLPFWPVYSPAAGSAMIFDDRCVVKDHHDRDLLLIAKGTNKS